VSSRSNGSASRAIRRGAGFLVLLLVLGAGVGGAEAARKKLVVLAFKGPKASRAQRGVVRVLKPSTTIVSGRAFLRAAREVEGYSPDASGVAKVATRLKAHGVLTGKVQKRGSKYKLTLQVLEGRSGEVIGDGIVVPLKRGRLDSAARRKLERELKAMLSELPEPGSAADGPVAASDGGEGDDPGGAAAEGGGAESGTAETGATGTTPTAGTDGGDDRAAPEPVPDPPRRKPVRERRPRRTRVASAGDVGGSAREGGGSSGEDADGTITREASEKADRDARGRGIDLSAGASFVARKLRFDFADGLAGPDQPQGYDGALVPGVYADAEIYPVALVNRRSHGFAHNIGVSAMVDKVLLIKSKLEGAGDESLPTAQTRYGVGLVYRWNFGSTPTSPTLVLGARYNQLSFSIDETEAPDPDAIQIPDVSYSYVDPGARLRLPLGERLAALVEAHYLVVLDAGQIQDPERYGKATVVAFDADVGAEVMITSNLVARAGARFMQYGLSFDGDGDQTDPTGDGTQDVDSATDRYLGFYAMAGVLF